MQRSPILQNPIYPRKFTDLTDFTDFTDLQLTDLWPAGRPYNTFSVGAGSRRRRVPKWVRMSTSVEVCFRTRAAAWHPNRVAEEWFGVEKYTARRDLTADGVDFESLCEWDE